MYSRASISALAAIVSLCLAATSHARLNEHEIVQESGVVLQQIMAKPELGIPQQLLSNAQAVVIVPRMKGGAFVVGIRKGRGVLVAREGNGAWRAPQFVEMTGGSVGWQAGVQSTDVILVFQSRESLDNLINGKLTIGADASVAAGPVGRKVAAATDLDLSAEIYSYSRSRGAFVGVSIDGTVLKYDPSANSRYYPPSGELPASAGQLISQLAAYAGGTPAVESSLVLPATPEAPLDAERHQLIQASNELFAMLDPAWRQHLALPEFVYQPGPLDAQRAPDLVNSLQRYEAIAAQPQYASLANRPEFQMVIASLRNLVAPPSQGQLTLPPPPGGAQIGQPRFPQ